MEQGWDRKAPDGKSQEDPFKYKTAGGEVGEGERKRKELFEGAQLSGCGLQEKSDLEL